MTDREFAEELRKWWSFDDGQVHTHSWHSREDFIAERLPKLLEAVRKTAGKWGRSMLLKPLITLQHKLNRRFVEMRDSGQNTKSIYAQLQIVERKLNRLGCCW